MTLFKLSLRNAKRQAGDYLVYFVTMIMVAAFMYSFNGLIFSEEILTLTRNMKSMPLIIVLASIVIVCIIGWLVQYTTRFIFTRRSREFGTYVLTGLENNQVAQLFFLENLVVGGFALVLGILLGNLLFQALRAIVLALFQREYFFSFSFSLGAFLLTILYFLGIYLSAQLRIRKYIRRMKIYDLIYFERQNEEEMISKSKNRRRVFTLSIVCGVLGTLLLMVGDVLLGITGTACVILFLYGFFVSFSSGVPAWFDKRPERKYRGRNLLIFRTLSAKLATMGVAMATIALLFTAVLMVQGTGLVFEGIFRNRAEQTNCFDLHIGSRRPERGFDDYLKYIGENIPVEASHSYFLYQGGDDRITDYVEENSRYFRSYSYDVWIKYSDYAALRKMAGYPKAVRKQEEYLIHCMPHLQEMLNGYDAEITAEGMTFKKGNIYTEKFNQNMWEGNGQGFLVVVPDEAAESRPVSHKIYAAMTKEPVNEAEYAGLEALNRQYDSVYAASQTEREYAAQTALFVFPLFYLALILTMTAATILTIQQLSEIRHYHSQFVLLRKLGMERSEMVKALRGQFAVYYAMPAVPPLLISIPFILNLGESAKAGNMAGAGSPPVILGITLGLFFLIYGLYIAIAYGSMEKSVLPVE